MIDILTRLVDALPVGVVALDRRGRAVIYNRHEEQLCGRRREDVLGTDFFREHAYCLDVPLIAGTFRERVGQASMFAEGDFSFPFPFLARPREVRVQLLSFEASGEPYGLLVIRDNAHERAVERMRQTLGEMLVHDMRGPLAAVVANLDALEATVRDPADAREAVEDALAAAKRMGAMLTNLLDTTRLETNTFPLRVASTDLNRLVTHAIELSTAVARAQTVTVDHVRGDGPVEAEIDAEVVQRMIENLLHNAIRHARHVRVRTGIEEDVAVVEVADDGPGIPAEQRARIFEKYAQVAPGEGHRRGHNRGLGLTFVRLAARAHGGDASVRCPPDGGSVFRVELPLHWEAPSSRPVALSR